MSFEREKIRGLHGGPPELPPEAYDEEEIDLSDELPPRLISDAIAQLGDEKRKNILRSESGEEYVLEPLSQGGQERTHVIKKEGKALMVVKSAAREKRAWTRYIEPTATALMELPTPEENPDAHFINRVLFVQYDEEHGVGTVGFEYANGGDLNKVARRADRNTLLRHPAYAAAVAEHIARGLRVLHDAHLLHIDIKLKNLLLHTGDDGETIAQLGDFGMTSTVRQRVERLLEMDVEKRKKAGSSIEGTLRNMDSDALNNKNTPASDVYALGIALAELLYGEKAVWDFVPPVMLKEENEEKREANIAVLAASGELHKNINAKKPRTRQDRADIGLPELDITPELSAFYDTVTAMVSPRPEDRPALEEVIETASAVTGGRVSVLLKELLDSKKK